MQGDDIVAVQAALGLDVSSYADLAVQRELEQVLGRWPFLAGSQPQALAAPARTVPAGVPRCLTLQGLRGGSGVTALVAALGHALQRLGQRVLMIDMNPDNQLRHHCNLPADAVGGWAPALFARKPWTDCAWRVLPGLYLLPYGRLADKPGEQLEQWLRRNPAFWSQRLAGVARLFDWVIFDVPQRLPGHARIDGCTLRLRVMEADPASQLLLRDSPALSEDEWLLVNRYDPTRSLQVDLRLLWQKTLAPRLVPHCVHEDEALREALAHQLPLGVHAPHSMAAEDVLSLATWCLAHSRRQQVTPPRAVEAAL